MFNSYVKLPEIHIGDAWDTGTQLSSMAREAKTHGKRRRQMLIMKELHRNEGFHKWGYPQIIQF